MTIAARSTPKKFVPLRESPELPDTYDGQRVAMVNELWASQDDLLRHRNRQIEENIRMLAGQQWSIYHPVLCKWIDPSGWMSDAELRWRQRPVINRLLQWFILTHARSTESQPIITFVPGPDRIDAELAEVMDITQKTLWTEMGMVDVNDRLMAWVIAAGRAHLQARIDPNGGETRQWIGEGIIPVVDENGQPMYGPDGPLSQHMPDGVRFDSTGQPVSVYRAIGGDPTRGELVHLGDAHVERKGKLVTDVFSPLEARAQWGPQPWHRKRWHETKQFLTPEEVFDLWGVEVEPDVGGLVTDVNELERILFGTGFFGAATSRIDAQTVQASTDGYCEVTCLWKAPCSYGGMQETEDSPGGRYTVVTSKKCIYDGVRPAKFPYTSPIRCFDFVRLPGRPSGTTPMEAMNPLQRAYNRGYAQVQEHVNLSTNPKAVIDGQSGLKKGQFTNRPGDNLLVNRRPGVPAVEYLAPPPLGQDVYKWLQMLAKELTDMGNLAGTEGEPIAPDQSGEAIKELRFNSDRFLGPTMRRAVEEYGRFHEDILCLLPVIWDEQTVISYAGDDNIARTITVLPMFFEQGHVHIRPDLESMLPESRGERQAKVWRMWQAGAFGPPLTPQALKQFHELARFPHLSRASRPGGVQRVTAEQFVGRLLQGEDPRALPTDDWYDYGMQLAVLEEFMASPEYLRQRPEIQQAMVFRRTVLKMSQQQQQQQQLAEALATQAQVAAATGAGGPGAPGGPPNGAPHGGGHASKAVPPSPHPIVPGLPDAPRGGVPGGAMPTAPTQMAGALQ